MKVGVVGGTGTISGPVLRGLLAAGHEVVAFHRGKRGGLPEGVRSVTVDRAERDAFERAARAERCDAAVDMIAFNREDAESTQRAFPDVAQLIHCSSCAVYGTDAEWKPLTEDHPKRASGDYPLGKLAAEAAHWEAHWRDGYPVTMMRPALTYGEPTGLTRQLCRDFQAWIDRIRKGKPLLLADGGRNRFHFLYAEDAAPAFVHALGRPRCVGQAYNVVADEPVTWRAHHATAMKVLGREVEVVGLPLETLAQAAVPGKDVCLNNFGHDSHISNARLRRDVPEFRPQVSLEEGMRRVIAAQDEQGLIPDSDESDWEDRLIAAQRAVADALDESAAV